MKTASILAGLLLLLPQVGGRLLPLARYRAGWLLYLSRILTEAIHKRTGLTRAAVDRWLALASVILVAAGSGGWFAPLSAALLLVLLEVAVRTWEVRLLADVYASAPRGATDDYGGGGGDRSRFPRPSVDPKLTVTMKGPFRARSPRYELGVLFDGQWLRLRATVGNHTEVAMQTPLRVGVNAPESLVPEPGSDGPLRRLKAGEVTEWSMSWRVVGPAPAGAITLEFEWGESLEVVSVCFDRVAGKESKPPRSAEIARYPGACRAAFAWRGDMDLYDEVTRQSIEGLDQTLSLATRYRMPQTMYLSTRLSLDGAAADEYGKHFGVDRGADRIPAFAEWMKANVEMRHSAAYPFESSRVHLVELGNHGHLHYGTDAAAAAENGWNLRARMGAGRYPWLGRETGSLAEQRDNALETADWCERLLGFRPRSWAMPDRTRDEFTPAAMEAAGCEVLSDSDIRTMDNVLFQPPPHHPLGTRAVELTKRYPGDPLDVFHVAMNVFWFHRAHRLGIPVVFMCHQHLRAYESRACAKYTEYLLRYVLHRFNGDLHVNTVFGIGKYWREVLSPLTRSVKVRLEGTEIVVVNGSDESFEEIPVDLLTEDGARFTRLVTVAAGSTARIDAFA